MKTIRLINSILVLLLCSFSWVACSDDDDVVDYSQQIIGHWFNYTGDNNVYAYLGADGTFRASEQDAVKGWTEIKGTYQCVGDMLQATITDANGTAVGTASRKIAIHGDVMTMMDGKTGQIIRDLYRIESDFNIAGTYIYRNAVANIVAKPGEEELVLPEGFTFAGMSSIPTASMDGSNLLNVAKLFFSELSFDGNGQLTLNVEGENEVVSYRQDGNDFTISFVPDNNLFDLQCKVYPDQNNERLFMTIPQQSSWGVVLIAYLLRENPDATITEQQVVDFCKHHADVFEKFELTLAYDKQ